MLASSIRLLNVTQKAAMTITKKAQRKVDRLLGVGTPRPLLALLALAAPFLIVGVMHLVSSNHVLFVAPCVSLCFASLFLCIQLLGGSDLLPSRWLLFVACCLTVLAGQNWYLVALMAAGVPVFLWAFDRSIGFFAPVLDPSSKNHRVFRAFDRLFAPPTSGHPFKSL